MDRTIVALRLAFWGLFVVLLAFIVSRQLAEVIPEGTASHIGRNSEGMLAILILTMWILYVRSRPDGRVNPMVAAGVTAVLALAGLVLWLSDFTSTVRTLNEPLFATAILVAYIAVPRPLPGWGWSLPIGAAVAAIVTSPTAWGTDLAETYVFLVLVPVALDWADRSILEPDQPTRPGRLVGWLAFIVLAPTFFSAVRPELPYENLVEETLRYMSRPTEAFLAVLLLHAFFMIDKIAGPSPARQDVRAEVH